MLTYLTEAPARALSVMRILSDCAGIEWISSRHQCCFGKGVYRAGAS